MTKKTRNYVVESCSMCVLATTGLHRSKMMCYFTTFVINSPCEYHCLMVTDFSFTKIYVKPGYIDLMPSFITSVRRSIRECWTKMCK